MSACADVCVVVHFFVCHQLCLDALVYSTVIKKKTIFRIWYWSCIQHFHFWILQMRAYSHCSFFQIKTCGICQDYSGFWVFFGHVYIFRICVSIGVHTKLGPILDIVEYCDIRTVVTASSGFYFEKGNGRNGLNVVLSKNASSPVCQNFRFLTEGNGEPRDVNENACSEQGNTTYSCSLTPASITQSHWLTSWAKRWWYLSPFLGRTISWWYILDSGQAWFPQLLNCLQLYVLLSQQFARLG